MPKNMWQNWKKLMPPNLAFMLLGLGLGLLFTKPKPEPEATPAKPEVQPETKVKENE